MVKILQSYNFEARFNLVRYNPHPNLIDSKESPRINELFNLVKDSLSSQKSYIVPRVDPQTYASCGMFIDDKDL